MLIRYIFRNETDGTRPVVKCTQARLCNSLGFQVGKVIYLPKGSEGLWLQIPHIADWIGTMILEARSEYNVLDTNGKLTNFYSRLNLDNASEFEPCNFRKALYFFIKRAIKRPLNEDIWTNNHGVTFNFADWTIEVCDYLFF